MSRHSKNCTSNAIFTNSEKQKLSSDYGTTTQRMGTESHLRFMDCHLCLCKAREPMLCPQGHVYCTECIMENLLKQKRQQLKDREAWELSQAVASKTEQKKQVESVVSCVDAFVKQANKCGELVQETKPDAMFKQVSKEEWKKTAFWMPENQTHVKEDVKPPTSDLLCPYRNDHKVRSSFLPKFRLTSTVKSAAKSCSSNQ